MTVKNGKFALEGEINPWVLLADGNLKHINEKTVKGHKLGDEVSGGILVGIKDADGGSKYVRRLDGMTENARKQEYEQLFNKELAERREQIYNALLSERVALRKDAINDIWRKAKEGMEEIDGEMRFIDPNTMQPIPHLEPPQFFPKEHPCAGMRKPRADVGHKSSDYGTWKKRLESHKREVHTRKEIIEIENKPELYQIEDRSSNRSRKYE